jgi:Complex I intermediate-associated protein 30 (CIA30)
MTKNQSPRKNWEFNRLLETLDYFDVIPFFSCLKNISKNNITTESGVKKMGTVLVANPSSDTGKKVVDQLLAKGYQVRGLVPENQFDNIWGNQVELISVNFDHETSLNPQIFNHVTSIICCQVTAQTIINNLAESATKYLPNPGTKILFDFTNPNTEIKNIWGAVDDVVMGGVSSSNIKLINDVAVFSGYVSTENSGGFVSVRTRNFNPTLNLSAYQGIELKVKGDGKRYKLFLRTESNWDSLAYSYSFDTLDNEWVVLQLPFNQFIPVFRAKTVNNAPVIDSSKICALQVMLSKFEYDGKYNPHFQEGIFCLEIDSISAYGGTTNPQFIIVNSDYDLVKIGHL